MEKYVKAEMEIIEFEAEDVITTSGCDCDYVHETTIGGGYGTSQ